MHSVPSCALLFIYFLVVSDMLICLEQHPDIQARIFGYKDECSEKLDAKPFSMYIQLQMDKWILAIHYHEWRNVARSVWQKGKTDFVCCCIPWMMVLLVVTIHHYLMLKPQISALWCYSTISTKRRKLCFSSLFFKLAFSIPILNIKESCGSRVLRFFLLFYEPIRRLQKGIHFSASFDTMPLQLALRARSWVLQTSTRRKTLTISSGDCILTWNKMSLVLEK